MTSHIWSYSWLELGYYVRFDETGVVVVQRRAREDPPDRAVRRAPRRAPNLRSPSTRTPPSHTWYSNPRRAHRATSQPSPRGSARRVFFPRIPRVHREPAGAVAAVAPPPVPVTDDSAAPSSTSRVPTQCAHHAQPRRWRRWRTRPAPARHSVGIGALVAARARVVTWWSRAPPVQAPACRLSTREDLLRTAPGARDPAAPHAELRAASAATESTTAPTAWSTSAYAASR